MSTRVHVALAEFDEAVREAQADIARLAEHLQRPDTVPELLARMFKLDQHLRSFCEVPHERGFDAEERVQFDELLRARWVPIDDSNTLLLKRVLATHGWPTIGRFDHCADNNAWAIAQHADHDRAFQREVLGILEPLVATGDTAPAHHAYLFDRVAVAEARPQRYGTQGRCGGPGCWEPKPIEDRDSVDELRAAVGLGPIADYIATMNGFCR